MTNINSTSKSLKSEVKKIRWSLIILTVIQIGYIFIVFTDLVLWVHLDDNYKANWVILVLHSIVLSICIWFNWNKMPLEKKKKTDNTFLMLFLGIIGMWLWIPNKREINKLTE